MSPFAIFVLILTFIYIIYYAAIIMQDMYAKKDSPKSEEEEFDVSNLGDQEEPIAITEDADGFRLGNQPIDENLDSGITIIDNDDDVKKYQESQQYNSPHISVEDECERLREAIEPIEVNSTGGTDPDIMLEMLINQKPGGPKIFYTRENA